MADQDVDKHNKTSNLSEKVVAEVDNKSFYNKYFPTDRKTYNLRIPFVGLILSVCTVYLLTICIFNREEIYLPQCLLIFIAAALGFELYYGLKIRDRQQFTPWIIFKVIELLFTFVAIVGLVLNWRWNVTLLSCALILFALNGWITCTVINTSLKMSPGCKNKSHVPDDDSVDKTYNVV
ncbi:uncharacterized protein LOC135137646 [Zophobas morio]|uniref:uncharacterized protein LOC135137646 n=1 Tax=Zophobas morio TaxID=2755281 RepID=UPI003082FF68